MIRLAIASVLTACLLGSASAQAPQAVERVRQATVFLQVTGPTGKSSGSGFILTPEGLIATAAHVVAGAQSVNVTLLTGERFEATGLVEYDAHLDLAIISIPGFDLATVPLGNSDSLQTAERVYAIGAPLGLEATVSDGIISAIRVEDGAKVVQISIPVSPGSSGGPVLTVKGQVVGVVVSGIRGGGAENLNFARPINYLRGRLTAAASRSPQTFSSYQYAGDHAGQSTTVLAANSRLNPFLAGLNWRALDGAAIYSKTQLKNRIQAHVMVSYAVTEDPEGHLVLDRRSYTHYRSQGMVTGRDLGREDALTTWRIDGDSTHFTTTYELKPFTSADNPNSWVLVADGARYSYRTQQGVNREGNAPLGILPPALVGTILAALPDSLPSQLSYWVLDPLLDRSLHARVTFGATSSMQVPVAKQGTQCVRGEVVTHLEQLEVVAFTSQIGTSTDQGYLLAHSPHLRVGGDVECILLPLTPTQSGP